ncbi:transmembrane protein 91-like [Mytilus trossulus]|uniref:transmembrane protein 91-like n=1 Tax=Mytilus trossulus TaxID=6551 RepID=UPI003005F66F
MNKNNLTNNRTNKQCSSGIDKGHESEPIDYMGYALMACLCCFWPLGLIAIRYANIANDAKARGDFEEARKQNSNARSMIIASVFFGLITIAAVVVIRAYIRQKQ